MIVRDDNYLIGLYQSEGGGRLKGLSHPSEIPTRHQLARSCEYMRVLNFADVSHSMRFNPIQLKYVPTLQDAITFADILLETFWKNADAAPRAFQLYKETSKDFFAACIWFFLNYKKMPYKDKNTMLWPEYCENPQTGHRQLTGRVFDTEVNRDLSEQARAAGGSYNIGLMDPDSYYWLGKYSDLPHILAFLRHYYNEVLDILKTDAEVFNLIEAQDRIFNDRDVELMDLTLLPLRTFLNKFQNKETYWILSKDGDDFDLSGRWNRDYLMLVCKKHHQLFFKVLNLFLCKALPDEKEWTCRDKEIESFKTVNEGLKITPYIFSSVDSKERILFAHYNQVYQDVEDLIKEVYLPEIGPKLYKR